LKDLTSLSQSASSAKAAFDGHWKSEGSTRRLNARLAKCRFNKRRYSVPCHTGASRCSHKWYNVITVIDQSKTLCTNLEFAVSRRPSLY